MIRKYFHIVPSGTYWQIKYLERILGNYMLKSDAIVTGRNTARANQPSELVIHNVDGTIGERETYGDDPYPPRG